MNYELVVDNFLIAKLGSSKLKSKSNGHLKATVLWLTVHMILSGLKPEYKIEPEARATLQASCRELDTSLLPVAATGSKARKRSVPTLR